MERHNEFSCEMLGIESKRGRRGLESDYSKECIKLKAMC